MDDESERFRKITMKVLTMQLNSVSVMDIVAYGGAAIGMIVTVKEYLAGNVSLAGRLRLFCLHLNFHSTAFAGFFLPHCHERNVGK